MTVFQRDYLQLADHFDGLRLPGIARELRLKTRALDAAEVQLRRLGYRQWPVQLPADAEPSHVAALAVLERVDADFEALYEAIYPRDPSQAPTSHLEDLNMALLQGFTVDRDGGLRLARGRGRES